jgi:hypothetical protein
MLLALPTGIPHLSQAFDLMTTTGLFKAVASSDAEAPNCYVVALADIADFARIETDGHFKRQFDEFASKYGANRDVALVIDASTEGWPFQIPYFSALHDALAGRHIDAHRVRIITTNHDLPTHYDHWAASNVKDAIKFVVYDYWCYKMGSLAAGELTRLGSLPNYIADQNIRRTKKLITLNRIFKAHRIAVVLLLLKHNHLASSLVSFMPDSAPLLPEERQSMKAYLERLNWTTVNELLPDFDRLADMVPLVLDEDSSSPNLKFVFGSVFDELYAQVAFTVTCESDFGVAGVDRVTEKPFKAIANCCPFILVGQPRQIERLRKLGFEVESYFSSDYDLIEDADMRLRCVLELVKSLCDTDTDELNERRTSCRDSNLRDLERLIQYGSSEELMSLARMMLPQLCC